jgi:hypothetical protein
MAKAPEVGGVRIEVDPKQWARLKADLDAVDKDITIQLRRRLRGAGMVGAERVRKRLGMPSPDGGPDEGKNRALLQAATKVTVSFRAKKGAVKIATSDRLLPAENKGLLKVYNLDTFRHPVFERADQVRRRRENSTVHRLFKSTRADWVEQKGNPYMGKEFMTEMRKEAITEINAALRDAIKRLER